MIAFDSPYVLYAAPAVAALMAMLALWGRHVRIQRALRWSPQLGDQAARVGRWGVVLIGVAVLAVGVALAGPRYGSRVVVTETKGLSLVLAVDISRSMLAEDVEPSRLGRSKREARRLIQDLGGDRIGLIAFAGQSFVMSPLTVDGGALQLLVGALDPDIVSAGGTGLASALQQGRDLLLAEDEVADRVLVVFTDGEAHDSLDTIQAAANQLQRDGIRLILVATGGRDPVRIPVRDFDGELLGYQRDVDDRIVETRRRDDVLSAIADAAHGVLVSAEVSDHAGAVRDLVLGFKRTPLATTTAAQDILRAWVPLLIGVLLLLAQTLTRRTAALVSVVLTIVCSNTAFAQGPRNGADEAWVAGEYTRATSLYRRQLVLGEGGDSTWFNAGTAALVSGDTAFARGALQQAAESIEPEIRFRALFNLGFVALGLAESDTANARAHLEEAVRRYREALLLRPADVRAKWNLELAFRRMPPPEDGNQSGQQPAGPEGASPPPAPQGLSLAQANQILNSVADQERETRQKLNRSRAQPRETRGRKDW